MSRQQKSLVVDQLKQQFQESVGAFAATYQGLDVNKMQSLRQGLREKGGKLQVAKARLMRRALGEGISPDSFVDTLRGQVCLVFVQEELPAVAKVLADFAKKNEALELLSGNYDDVVLDSAEISRLASLPSREVLLGLVAGTLNAPVSALARILHMLLVRLAYVLKQIEEQKARAN